MTTMIFKVDDTILREFKLILEKEGMNNRTSAFIFLIKHYFLTQQNSLDNSIATLNAMLDRMDTSKLPSAEEQLKDV